MCGLHIAKNAVYWNVSRILRKQQGKHTSLVKR